MRWTPDDWSAWIDGAVATPASDRASTPEHVRVARAILDRVPGRDAMALLVLGLRYPDELPRWAHRYGSVVAVDPDARRVAAARDADASIRVRRRDLRDLTPFHSRCDMVAALDTLDAFDAGGGPTLADVDRMFEQSHRCLHEGGLLVATTPASRDASARPFLLRDERAPAAPPRFHEAELQYRLSRAGFQGVRVRRVGGERLLALAVRRAPN